MDVKPGPGAVLLSAGPSAPGGAGLATGLGLRNWAQQWHQGHEIRGRDGWGPVGICFRHALRTAPALRDEGSLPVGQDGR